MDTLDGLWPENAEAWRVYQLLCGRTVSDCQAASLVLDRVTDGWEIERFIALVDRLDIVANVLSPHNNGPTQARNHRR
jgi:hypothetical protein